MCARQQIGFLTKSYYRIFIAPKLNKKTFPRKAKESHTAEFRFTPIKQILNIGTIVK